MPDVEIWFDMLLHFTCWHVPSSSVLVSRVVTDRIVLLSSRVDSGCVRGRLVFVCVFDSPSFVAPAPVLRVVPVVCDPIGN